ncbi:Cytochrome c oxidase subunit 2 [Candidatus Methylobacter favarea]|uniref:Cytochrome c oxidase subunit 2 n=1 Tax=Candidatus Methylobacter favarea TaxID=2707345 RepID=A0A8S0YAM1_9GAMM|nr:c-type cytochrome [Candidatus Methylobacter favarea]CAA9892197.1 Cytochrome c oxidase subunit 2 [Candidatus Methylobacter favarea]
MNEIAFLGIGFPAALSNLSISALATAAEAPLNYFLHSYGPASRPTMILGWVLAVVCLAVCIIIGILLVAAITRKRQATDSRTIGREEEGLGWIYIGAGLSTCVLLALAVYAMITLNAIAKPATAPGLTLTVTGYDWWWKVTYEDEDPARRFVTANEIHIPVGVPVLIKLNSADVIHAFWVPQLAGKTEMIPGLMNQQWLQADVAGTYRGQCSQYCGAQHAHMAVEVVAQAPANFKYWQETQRQKAALSSAVSIADGMKLFMERCSGCHAIRGTEATGEHGPDLTHLNSRHRIAAGLRANTPRQVIEWVIHAQEIKPGSRMPSISLSPSEMADLAAFLATLN